MFQVTTGVDVNAHPGGACPPNASPMKTSNCNAAVTRRPVMGPPSSPRTHQRARDPRLRSHPSCSEVERRTGGKGVLEWVRPGKPSRPLRELAKVTPDGLSH